MSKLGLIGASAAGFTLIMMGFASCSEVPTGHRGIVSTFGKVDPVPRSEGLVWLTPFVDSLDTMDIRTQKWDGKTEAYTRDVQKATVRFTLTYSLVPSQTAKMYQEVGEDWKSILVTQVVKEQIKEAFGNAAAVTDVINGRSILGNKIRKNITQRFKNVDIEVAGFEITDVEFSRAFEDSVEQKEVAVQDAITAQNKTARIQEQAKQKLITAEAEAKSMEIRSKALSRDPGLVAWEAVQKWDGVLPRNMYGANAIPFIQQD